MKFVDSIADFHFFGHLPPALAKYGGRSYNAGQKQSKAKEDAT